MSEEFYLHRLTLNSESENFYFLFTIIMKVLIACTENKVLDEWIKKCLPSNFVITFPG
jgi:hypothetical protein